MFLKLQWHLTANTDFWSFLGSDELWTITSACKSAAKTVLAFRLGFIALFLPGSARMATSLGAIAEVALALAMRITRVASWTVRFHRGLFTPRGRRNGLRRP